MRAKPEKPPGPPAIHETPGGTRRMTTEALIDGVLAPVLGDEFALAMIGHAFCRIVDASPRATFVTDVPGHVVHLNDAAEKLCGSPRCSAIGRHVADLLYTPLDTELRSHRSMLELALFQGIAANRSAVPVTLGGGHMQLVDYHLTPLTDGEGHLTGGLLIATEFRRVDRTRARR